MGGQPLTSQDSSPLVQDAPPLVVGGNASTSGSGLSVVAPTVKCSGCDNPIAFQPPIPGEPVGVWLCKSCGAVYYGDDAANAAANAFGVVRASQAMSNQFPRGLSAAMDARSRSIPPEYVQRLVASLTGDAYTGPERRMNGRYRMAVPVIAVPLGLDFQVAGEPLRMTTMNVSLGGASLMHTRFTQAPYFALDFTVAGVEHLQMMLQVLSVRNFGPVYEVAGRFIDGLGQKPIASSNEKHQRGNDNRLDA